MEQRVRYLFRHRGPHVRSSRGARSSSCDAPRGDDVVDSGRRRSSADGARDGAGATRDDAPRRALPPRLPSRGERKRVTHGSTLRPLDVLRATPDPTRRGGLHRGTPREHGRAGSAPGRPEPRARARRRRRPERLRRPRCCRPNRPRREGRRPRRRRRAHLQRRALRAARAVHPPHDGHLAQRTDTLHGGHRRRRQGEHAGARGHDPGGRLRRLPVLPPIVRAGRRHHHLGRPGAHEATKSAKRDGGRRRRHHRLRRRRPRRHPRARRRHRPRRRRRAGGGQIRGPAIRIHRPRGADVRVHPVPRRPVRARGVRGAGVLPRVQVPGAALARGWRVRRGEPRRGRGPRVRFGLGHRRRGGGDGGVAGGRGGGAGVPAAEAGEGETRGGGGWGWWGSRRRRRRG